MEDKSLISFDGTKIAYKYYKSKSKESPIVLVHGFTGSLSGFQNTFNFIKNKKRSVLAFDLRAHGFSQKPIEKEKYFIDSFAKDLQAILKKERIRKINLVGHCFGAMICIRFVDLNPTVVKKLMLISTDYDQKKHFINKLIYLGLFPLELISKLLPKEFLDGNSLRINYAQFKKHTDWHIPRMIADIKSVSTRAYFILIREILNLNLTDSLKSITMPTLIVHGNKDTLFNFRRAINMHKLIPKSSLIILEGINHVEHIISAKPVINEIIEDFMLND